MSLADLSKQQKQFIILGITGSVFVLILAVIGIKISLSSIAEAKEELAGISEKIDKADSVLSKRNRAGQDFERTVSILKDHLRNIPPEINYYSWATEIIYSNGRNSEMEIESVDEIGGGARKHAEDSGAAVQFESYSLRIAARGSYEQVKTFLKSIEEEYPLVRFTGIDIKVGKNSDTHAVQLFLQWPFNLGQITKVWDDVEAKQMKIAKRDALKAKSRTPVPVVTAIVPDSESKSVVVPTPKPEQIIEPDPEVMKQAPVVAVVIPDPEPEQADTPMPKSDPIVQPIPEIVEPVPVIAAVIPEPEFEQVVTPTPKPEPTIEPIPEVVKPAPVIVAVIPDSEPESAVAPMPKSEPVPVNENLDSLLESLASEEVVESAPEVVISDPVAEESSSVTNKPNNELGSLLASLDSRGDEEAITEGAQSESEASSEDLESYLKQLGEQQAMAKNKPEHVEEQPVEKKVVERPAQYVSSAKSTALLVDMLTKEKPKTSENLSSFLNGIGGGYQ